MTGPRLDEADRLRNDTIRWQRKIIGVLLTAVLVGMLVAVVGGPASIQALQAVQSFVGVMP